LRGFSLVRKWSTFLAGLLMGLASTGLILLLIRQPRQYPIQLLPPPTPGPLSVHVAGAAERPGVYLLPRDSIVQDALAAAGGPTSSADLDRINLAANLEDGQRVYIPQIKTSGSSAEGHVLPSEINPDQMININTASAAELELLPGIGPSLAKEIIDHRSANGLFNTADDLLAVSGIGPAKVALIRDLITFH
jgi:competence protein ComEA